ncbi:hypothetical protein CCHL11_10220 [Colletotrichum chlorophyti]|uniref:SprT-like domain-containing protein n=1 Tax=Colletotrichum chlorophyti TaxID=708187 RepID=A0A1Q8R9K5_9PEZI|nr:hypothetical protein CCHL11_10220 [Colletotrichum chlorophyti]
MFDLSPCRLHSGGRASEPPAQIGVYYARDLVLSTMDHGCCLDLRDAADAKDMLIYGLIEGLHELYDSADEEHFGHVRHVAGLVDRCFLGGYLTRAHELPDGQQLAHLRLDIKEGNDSCQDSWSGARVTLRDGLLGSLPVVNVDIDSKGPWTIVQIIELVIHEMIHGYIMLFACRGNVSHGRGPSSGHSNARGRHGNYVRLLLHHVFSTIQGWDDELSGFGRSLIMDCNHNGDFWEDRCDPLVFLGGLW